MKATVLAESSSFFIFSTSYLRYQDGQSGRCRFLPSFLTFFINMFCLSVLVFVSWPLSLQVSKMRILGLCNQSLSYFTRFVCNVVNNHHQLMDSKLVLKTVHNCVCFVFSSILEVCCSINGPIIKFIGQFESVTHLTERLLFSIAFCTSFIGEFQ